MASYEWRVTKSGEKRCRARVRLDGFPPQYKTFRTKTDAKHWAQDIETRLAKGEAVTTSDQRRITLANVIDRYIEYLPRKKNNKSSKQTIERLSYWKKYLGNVALLNDLKVCARH
jgi:hypothetical protein